jgi:branched-subunit amino acid aminotransferase/4-amino-4-deoxychorismate lyase
MKRDFGIEDFAAFCRAHRPAYHAGYYAMYSSGWGATTTEPNLMVVPVDDHMVHRGDGLFETIQCEDGALYNFGAHWRRLERGAESIALELRWSREDVVGIVREVMAAAGRRDALVRIFASRGPGGHTANPYECPEPHLMVLAIRLPRPFMEGHPEGAKIGVSGVPAKEGVFAQVKSVNYLPNVLMRKQAVDAGVDFMLGFDKNGHMTELPTENFGIVTGGRVLRVPRPGGILAGTTMLRVLELAREKLVPAGVLAGVEEADVPLGEIEAAAELLVFGTTPRVTAATEFGGRAVGDGRPGPVWRELGAAFEADLKNPAMLTRVCAEREE